MRITKDDIPVKIDVPGAVARQAATSATRPVCPLGGEYFSLGAGTDIAPLLEGSTTTPATRRTGAS